MVDENKKKHFEILVPALFELQKRIEHNGWIIIPPEFVKDSITIRIEWFPPGKPKLSVQECFNVSFFEKGIGERVEYFLAYANKMADNYINSEDADDEPKPKF